MANKPTLQIPVIDISSSNPQAASQLLSSAATFGFVFIENNDAGIAPADIRHMFALSKDFFAAPTAVKEEVAIASNKAGKNHGWLSRGVEKLDPKVQLRADVKEAFNMGEPVDGIPQQPLPAPLAPHAATLLAFQRSCYDLCSRILTLFAQALDIEKDWFTTRHDPSQGPTGTVFRLLYYPYTDDYDDELDIRAGAHSDYGSITLLFQQAGQPGLEIKGPGGQWVPVPVDPAATTTNTTNNSSSSSNNGTEDHPLPILVNIGDLLEDWTGGLLKSTVHRVIFPHHQFDDGAAGGAKRADRYSIAYFCHPLDDAELEAVPSEVVQEHARRSTAGMVMDNTRRRNDGKVLTARDHLMERLGASYTVK